MTAPTNTPLNNPPADYCPPGSARWFTIPEGSDAGKTLFYFDHQSAPAAPAATVVFAHGNPESSYTYRHVRERLLQSSASLRVIGVDHVGFGLSDQATFEMVDMHHAANLRQLVHELDLHDVTLVVHDWGGPIGVGAFIDEPQRVRNLVVMNTTIFPMPSDGITYENFPMAWMPWSKTPALVPDALWGGVAAHVVSRGEPQSSARFLLGVSATTLRYALGQIADETPEGVWSSPMRSRANAKSSKRNVRQTPHWGHGYRYEDPTLGVQDNHAFYANMQDKVPRVWRDIGAAGHFGSWDACGKASVIRQWHEALPGMVDRTHVYPHHGHFIEEYEGAEIALSILRLNGASS